MIEGDLLPPAGILVALLACNTELSLVWVVFLVTGHATGRELVAVEIPRVAGIAFCGCMPAPQSKFRCLVVVERNGRPLRRRMARFAFLAIPSGVLVLNAVAGNARNAGALVFFARMAGYASDITVCAHKWKLRFGVIEHLRLAPILF